MSWRMRHAVLLNRAGKTSADDTDLGFYGGNANGPSVTVDDSAANDIHLALFALALITRRRRRSRI